MALKRNPEIYALYCSCENCDDKKPRYVGQSVEGARVRFVKHLSSARQGKPWAVSRWIRKHGEENIRFEVLKSGVEVSELDDLEQALIQELGTSIEIGGYNIQPGGNGVSGYKHHPNARSKITGWHHSEETRARISEAVRGRFGENSSNARITQRQAEEVIQLFWDGMTLKEVAKKTGIKLSTVTGIASGESWRALPRPEYPRRVVKTGRFEKGGRPASAKLRELDVRDIRRRLREGEEVRDLAQEYSVTPENVGMIRDFKTWKHVK